MGKESARSDQARIATFAAGCFWSKEYFFSRAPGVLHTQVGFTGGHTEKPTYREVCTKTTGHAEAVAVSYDPDATSFEALARLFFELHDPTIDRTGKGGQYRSAIFYHDDSQRQIAERLIRLLRDNGYEVVTQLEPAGPFWPADERHQKYCEVRDIIPQKRAVNRFEKNDLAM